jgi:hypothetical protein
LTGLRTNGSTLAKGRLQVGFSRPLETPVVVNRDTALAGDWKTLPNGWRVWSVEVSSSGAVGVRLHFDSLVLPSGARVVVYDPANPGAAAAVNLDHKQTGQGEIWSQTTFSDLVVVECQVPPGADVQAVSIAVRELSHVYQHPLAKSLAKDMAGACNNDVSCFPAWAIEASGVALISFMDSGVGYVCSGCLLAQNTPNNLDYFLTANHCIGNKTIAGTIEFYWFYQTTNCHGTVPDISTVPQTGGGADLLATSLANDFSFLHLRQASPSNSYLLGWSTATPTTAEKLACIHHPQGEYKRISFGNQIGSDPNFWDVQWSDGVTEPGSSGSPLMNSNHQVIGQLYGGLSDCSNPTGIDTFGQFYQTYKAIRQWIDPNSLTNTYTPVAASFTGLFYDPSGVSPASSGYFTMTTTAKGKFTGKLQIGNTRFPFSGQFADTGYGEAVVARHNQTPLTLSMQMDLNRGGSHLDGTIASDSWTAALAADRAAYDGRLSQAPQAGHYTMVMRGSANSTAAPGGDGYATVSVSAAGAVRLAGTLGDGSKVTQSSVISGDGQWPLYIPAYTGKGLLLSWVSFASDPLDDFTGVVDWLKPGQPGGRFYPAGITQRTTLTGSKYQAPAAGGNALGFSAADVVFSVGGLDRTFTNHIVLGPNSRVLNNGSNNKLTMTFSPGTGMFSGRVADPSSGLILPFNGAVVQKGKRGSGSFWMPSIGESGRVVIQPAPAS